MLHYCWWKEQPRIFAVLGLLGWRSFIVVCDVIRSLVGCLFYLLHFTWYMKKRDTVYLLVCDWSFPHVLFTVTSCGIATLIWRGILQQADRAGPLENLLLCSEASSCATTTLDILVLSDGAHRTRNIFTLRFMCSAHDCVSQTMYKYELGERDRENVSLCVCVSHVA